MIGALASLLGLQLLGEVLVRLLGLPLPGPVLGMALLWLGLTLQPAWRERLRPVASTLLQHLSLLFVPAGVGVLLHLHRLGEEALAIGVSLVLSTWVGLAVTALCARWLIQRLAGTQALES